MEILPSIITKTASGNFCPKSIWDKSQLEVENLKNKGTWYSTFKIDKTKVPYFFTFLTRWNLTLRFVSNTFFGQNFTKAAIVNVHKAFVSCCISVQKGAKTMETKQTIICRILVWSTKLCITLIKNNLYKFYFRRNLAQFFIL